MVPAQLYTRSPGVSDKFITDRQEVKRSVSEPPAVAGGPEAITGPPATAGGSDKAKEFVADREITFPLARALEVNCACVYPLNSRSPWVRAYLALTSPPDSE